MRNWTPQEIKRMIALVSVIMVLAGIMWMILAQGRDLTEGQALIVGGIITQLINMAFNKRE